MLFLAATIPFIIAEGMIRALGMVVLLEQYSHVAGAASAMINFVLNLIGTVGASLATLDWGSYITALAVICIGCMAAALFCGLLLYGRKLWKSGCLDLQGDRCEVSRKMVGDLWRFCDLRKRFSGCKEFVIIRPYTK